MRLMNIAQSLGRQDLEELLFICEPFLSESTAEETPSAVALFRELEHRVLIAPGQYEFLKKILTSIGRVDLVNKLPPLKRKLSGLSSARLSKAANWTEKSLLLVISDGLRKRDVQRLAFLSSSKYSDGLSLMEDLEDKGLISEDNYDYLARQLGEIGRLDLCRIIATKDFGVEAASKTVQEEIATW